MNAALSRCRVAPVARSLHVHACAALQDTSMKQQLAARVTSLKRCRIDDGYKNIEVQQTDVPEPSHGQALVKMTSRPILPADLLSSAGVWPGTDERIPFTEGLEGVGTVVKSASGNLKEGQRVVSAFGWNGTWQEYAVADESSLLTVPDNLDDDTAAQAFVNPTTVVGLVDAAGVPKGGYLLQAAAAGAVGRQLIQYAKHVGIKTINLVRRQEQVQQLKDLGADHVINQSEEDVVAAVMEITGGEGAYAALDPVAGDFTGTLLECVRMWGTVHVFGALQGGADITFPLMNVFVTGKAVRGWILLRWLNKDGPEKARERLDYTMQLLADGVMTPPKATETYPLGDLHAAIAAHQKAGRDGKIFIK